jgi:hypothetical protein
VAIPGAATGVVVTLSTRDSLIRFGAKSFSSRRRRFLDPQGERSDHHIGDLCIPLRLFQGRNVAGGAFEKREPTLRLRMPALLTALPERAQSGLHR